MFCLKNVGVMLMYSVQDVSWATRCQMSLIPNTVRFDKLSVLDNPEDFIHDYNTKNVGLK